MKISNETKVGALTTIAITVLILGFNFLKGKDLTTRGNTLYTIFPNVEGLVPSNPVMVNGLQVGKVTALKETDKNVSGIIVTLTLTKDINVPHNSVAVLSKELLGTPSVNIHLGSGTDFLDDGDTIRSERSLALADKLQNRLDPTLDNLNKTMKSLDELIQKFNTMLDPTLRNNVQNTIANIANTTKSLSEFFDQQNGSLAKSMKNVETITNTFARNGSKIDSTLSNLEQATGKLADANLDGAIASMQQNMDRLQNILARMETKDGSLGALLNDRQLYDEIRNTNRSLNILLDDLRVHPKRYINISVFGKKDKSGPLMAPVSDSTRK